MCGRFLTRTSSTIMLAFAGALAAATLAGAAGPFANINVTAMPGNEAENAIAVNPTDPSNVVAMSTLPDVVAGLAVGVSFDSGQTWARRVIGTAGDPLGEICCDQQLAWDRFGNLWMTYLVNTNGHVLVALSTNGGMSFTKVADLVTNGDQPSIAVGQNSVWISYTFFPGTQIQAFGAPVTGLGQFGSFSAPENVPSPHSNGDYGDTAVGPAGQVMVTYQNATNGQGGTNIYTAVDPDGLGPAGFGPGGFAAHSRVAHSHVGGFDYIPAQPDRSIDAEANLAWDRSGGAHNGRVYLIWTQETPNESDNTDIMFQHSDDSGATWSAATKLNDDNTGNSQYNPAIALDQSSGDVAVSWYDTRNDLGTGGSGDTNGIPNDDFQIWATYSTTGGVTLAPNFRVSAGTSNAADADSFFDTGDYTHAAFVSGAFWPAWSDNSNSTGDNPDGTLHQLDLYTAKVPIRSPGHVDVLERAASRRARLRKRATERAERFFPRCTTRPGTGLPDDGRGRLELFLTLRESLEALHARQGMGRASGECGQMRKTTLATVLLAGFLLAALASTDFAPSTPEAFARAAGTLKLSRALLTGHVFQVECPAGTDPSTACFQSSGAGLIPGLGRASERKLIFVDDPDSSCERWHSNSVIAVAGKGEIDLSLRPPNRCVIPTTGLLNGSLVYSVTGGSGTYAGASGSGTFVVRGGPGTTGREADTLSGSLIVPGLTFDLTPPIFRGATSKTMVAPRGASAVRVRYVVTARDPGHGAVVVRCKPRSGSRFKIGRTRVTCSAIDSSANKATARFVVIVKSAS